MYSAVQDMMPCAELTLQFWVQPFAGETGIATGAVLCQAEQTCKNYAVVVVVAETVPGLNQRVTLVVEKILEACCITLYLAVALAM